MKGSCWNKAQHIYLYSCTNPNHAYSVYRELINGHLYPVKVKHEKKSQMLGNTVYYHDGQNERKMSRSMLRDIRSRAVTPDGEVLIGKKGEKYNKAHGQKDSDSDVIYG